MPPPRHYDMAENKEYPWWVRAIYLIGIPSAIAGYLVYTLSTGVNSTVNLINTNLQAHQIDTSYLIKANQESQSQQRVMYNLLQQICINTARTAEDRQNCWNPWRMNQ